VILNDQHVNTNIRGGFQTAPASLTKIPVGRRPDNAGTLFRGTYRTAKLNMKKNAGIDIPAVVKGHAGLLFFVQKTMQTGFLAI